MEQRLAWQRERLLSRHEPQGLYEAALVADEAYRSLALMAAAAELRHPLACHKMRHQSPLWQSISALWQCLYHRPTTTIPQSLLHLAPPREACASKESTMVGTLEGWANEFGQLPRASREKAIRAYVGLSSLAGPSGPFDVLAAERLSALQHNGMAPFLTMLGRTELCLATRTLCAAAAARCALTPLLETEQAHRTPLNAFALFDGLFAALAAASQKHAGSALLLARVLHRRFGAQHLATAKTHYEAAVRGWSFDACIALLRLGDERMKTLASACAIGTEEEAEVRRVLDGGMSTEEERLGKGEWLMTLPPNAEAILDAVLALAPRCAEFTLSRVEPTVTLPNKDGHESIEDIRFKLHNAAPVSIVVDDTTAAPLPVVSALGFYTDETPAQVQQYANVPAPPSALVPAFYANAPPSPQPRPGAARIAVYANEPQTVAPLNSRVDSLAARPALHSIFEQGSVHSIVEQGSGTVGEGLAKSESAQEVWAICCATAFDPQYVDATPRRAGVPIPNTPRLRTEPCFYCPQCSSLDEVVVEWGDGIMCTRCFAGLKLEGLELRAGAVAAVLTNSTASRATTRLLSTYENLTEEGALREWPFWVTYAQFEALYELRPPRNMQHLAWLEHLCATRFFYGRMSSEAAGRLVRAEAGLFVVRMSSVAGCLTVSVGVDRGRVQHHRVGRSEGGGFVLAGGGGASEREVATLREALVYGKGLWGLRRGAGASPYRRAMGANVPDPYADFCP